MLKKLVHLPQTRHAHAESRCPATTLKATTLGLMTVIATAHSEPRGSLCSTSCTSFQPSAAEFDHSAKRR